MDRGYGRRGWGYCVLDMGFDVGYWFWVVVNHFNLYAKVIIV